MQKQVEIVKKIITEKIEKKGLKVEKIILFGSRVRSDYNPDSDWDFLVIVDRDLTFPEIKKILGEIQWSLAEENIPNDIVLRGNKDYEYARRIVGNISYFADKEGIPI